MSRLLLLALLLLISGEAIVLLLLAASPATPPANPTASAPEAAPARPLPRILVARRDLEAGETLGDWSIQWQPWPEEALGDKFIRENSPAAAHALGALLRTAAVSGQPIVQAQLSDRRDGGALPLLLHPGMRAVTVPTDEATSSAGLLQPGDHVDVILVTSLDPGLHGAAIGASETILENIRILAVDRALSKSPSRDAAAGSGQSRTVTLEVSPYQSNKLALAMQLGRINLTVRPVGSGNPALAEAPAAGSAGVRDVAPDRPVWAADVAQGLAPFFRRAQPLPLPGSLTPAPPPPKRGVLVIRGNDSRFQEFVER